MNAIELKRRGCIRRVLHAPRLYLKLLAVGRNGKNAMPRNVRVKISNLLIIDYLKHGMSYA